MGGKSVFVTVGTTRFDELCRTVFAPESIELLERLGYSRMLVQMGAGDCESPPPRPGGLIVETYRYKDSIAEDMRRADLIVSHAGAGSCLEALDLGKRLLVVVNERLMHNHQTEIADKLSADGHLWSCTCRTFRETLERAEASPLPEAEPARLFRHLEKAFGAQ